jgi:hypothetical protein
MVMPLALGVAPPSSLSASFAAPEPAGMAGDERKNSGDCVDAESCNLEFLGVACDPRCEACEASDCNCSSGPTGAGLLAVGAPRALLRGVTESDVRCERRFVGDDMLYAAWTAQSDDRGVLLRGCYGEGGIERVAWGAYFPDVYLSVFSVLVSTAPQRMNRRDRLRWCNTNKTASKDSQNEQTELYRLLSSP